MRTFPLSVFAWTHRERAPAAVYLQQHTDWTQTAAVCTVAEEHTGEEGSLEKLPGTYLGPILHVKPGQKIRVRFTNLLPDETIIHWHGLHISPEMDGHPMYAIDKGEKYIYEFTVHNRPGTYWFHPHPDQITGPQVYYGLAGMFIVEDEHEEISSMQWVINGKTFAMKEVAEWEKVKLNTAELWVFRNGNDAGGMGMMRNYEVME